MHHKHIRQQNRKVDFKQINEWITHCFKTDIFWTLFQLNAQEHKHI